MKSGALILASFATAAMVGACSTSGHTGRDAVGGAALGAVAGAVIGGDVRGAAIGAAAGGIGGTVVGNQQDEAHAAREASSQPQGQRGPNGESMRYDERANRSFYLDQRDGRTYWSNGDYRN